MRLDLCAELGALVLVCIYCEQPSAARFCGDLASKTPPAALPALYAIRWGEWGADGRDPISAEEFRRHQVPLRRGVWDVLGLLA